MKLTGRDKLLIYTLFVITSFMIAPSIIFDGDFEKVMIYTWPSIFLGVGFVFLSVWIYEKIYNWINNERNNQN